MNLPADSRAVHVRAPGKINLYLGVGGRQTDGYHELATVFQAVSLFEDVTATLADEITVHTTGPQAHDGVPTDDRNLAVRAAKLLAHATGYRGGAHLEIYKQVPVAGGMGGGSADAAATLVALDHLWQLGLTLSELHELGSQLGADVPFALQGGTAIGTGRGDDLHPALATGRFDWVLLTSSRGLSTPEVYARLDSRREENSLIFPLTPEVPPVVLQSLRGGSPEDLAEALHNDLQAPACELRPELADTIRHGVVAGALNAIVSGSGPTVALLCGGADEAAAAVERLREAGLRGQHVHGPVHGARIMNASPHDE